MTKLKCKDYGFECDFVTEGEIEKVIEDFRNHTDEEHGIDYSKEAIMQFLLRKQGL
jgi:predicted small metal-binding protein